MVSDAYSKQRYLHRDNADSKDKDSRVSARNAEEELVSLFATCHKS